MGRDHIPIVLTVFGTTRSKGLYNKLFEEVEKAFPRHPVSLAFTSRMVHAMEAEKRGAENVPPLPSQVFNDLAEKGHKWAVVQSIHMLAGHEFYRMVEEVNNTTLRTSVGLPLLWSRDDYEQVAWILQREYHHTSNSDTALIFIGHGTDHASWSSYPALEHTFREQGILNAWVGVVDGEPGPEHIIRKIMAKGFKKALLIPLMLVAGVHVLEDIEGNGDEGGGWQGLFRAQGIDTYTVQRGLLEIDAIRRLFIDHIEAAMEMVPLKHQGT